MRKGDMRKAQILSVSERLFCTEGYDAVSVNRIIAELGISKGGFYHHFSAKDEVLEAICFGRAERSYNASLQGVRACAGGAIDKLNSMFDKYGLWNETDADYLGLLMRVAYRPENLRMRETLKHQSMELTLALLNDIIAQGVREGVFSTPYPDTIGRVIMLLGNSMTDGIAERIFIDNGSPDMVYVLEVLELYRHTIERLLDAPPESVILYQIGRIAEVVEAISQKQGLMGVEPPAARRRGRVIY